MHKRTILGHNFAALIAFLSAPAPMPHPRYGQRHFIPAGRIYRSRSRYIPGGAARNCGDRGISPKRLRQA